VQLGETLALGSRSTIHTWGNDSVAKVPLPSTPEGWIEFEARYALAVRATGAPVPELRGIETIGGRAVSIFARARGPSMWTHLVARPGDVDAMARTLAELQCDLHTVAGPVELPRLVDRLACKLRSARARYPDEVPSGVVDAVPTVDAHRLCHGDLHPGNVILTDSGPIIVDWFDVTRGEPLADIARSMLLMAPDPLGAAPTHLPGATSNLLTRLGDAYRTTIEERSTPDPAALEQWLAIMAVARVAEGVPSAGLLARWHRWADD